MVRVAIFPSYGGIFISEEAKKYIESKKPQHWRVSLAEYIDNLEDTHEKISQNVYNEFIRSKDPISYIKSKDLFFFKEIDRDIILGYRVEIVDVDNTRKWKISDYDGAEDVVYFPKPVLVDEKLNMYSW